jgi:uncharacterized protein YndB with AHSA1/START domain
MKDLRLTITIDKPAQDVFAFTIDPRNTPKWIDAITVEESNEWPPKVGTVYRNQSAMGEWREFEMTAFEPGKTFTLSKKDGYHVRYTCKPLTVTSTELEYYEWVETGTLQDILTMETLEKLKQVIEHST